MTDQQFRDAAYPETTEQVFATLLTIEHDDLAAAVLITDAGEDIVYGSDLLDGAGNVAAKTGTYVNLPIEIIPPGQTDEQMRGTIRIPNIDQAIGEMVESISTPARITITVVLAGDTSVIVGGPHFLLELANVRGDALVVEGEISRPALTAEPYPKDWVRPSVFRAAYRISS
ncbi:MAG: DUF1833 family protein [Devosia sp.]